MRAGISSLPVIAQRPASPLPEVHKLSLTWPPLLYHSQKLCKKISLVTFSQRLAIKSHEHHSFRAKFDINSSAFCRIDFNRIIELGFFRSIQIDCSPRFNKAKMAICPAAPVSNFQAKSPSGRSIVITRTPASASNTPQ